jgi:hypothetical protein
MSTASYVQGAGSQPLIGATIGGMFDAIAETHFSTRVRQREAEDEIPAPSASLTAT